MKTEQDSLTETLRGIASGSRRSKIARLREYFDEVEAAKDAGASNKTIVDGLAAHGLIFDVNNFKNARSRILKERAMEGLTKAASAANQNRSTDNLHIPHQTNTNEFQIKPPVEVMPVTKKLKSNEHNPVAINRIEDVDLINKSSLPGFGKTKPKAPN